MSKLESLKPSIANTLSKIMSAASDTERETIRDETITRLGKIQTPTTASFMGSDHICGVTWVGKDDYNPAELKSLKQLFVTLGSSRTYTSSNGKYIGYAVPEYSQDQSKHASLPSFLSYIDTIKDNIFGEDVGRPNPPQIVLIPNELLQSDLRTHTLSHPHFVRSKGKTEKVDGVNREDLEYGDVFTPITFSSTFRKDLKRKVGDQLFMAIPTGDDIHLSPKDIKRDYEKNELKRILGRGFDFSKRINTVIYLDSAGNRLVCGFFSDGSPVPALDSHYDSSVDLFVLVEVLSRDLQHITSYIDRPSNWTQFFYIIDEQSEELNPQNKQQRKAIDRLTNATMRKVQRTALALFIASLAAGIYAYQYYQDWSSADAQKERERVRLEEQKRLERDAQERTDLMKSYANEFLDKSAYHYPPNLALKSALNNILPIPLRITEGKLEDGWKLSDWNCVSQAEGDQLIDSGLSYRCLINYVGERLAQEELFTKWANNSPALKQLQFNDVVSATGSSGITQSGLLTLDFTVSPSRLSSDLIVGDDEMQRMLAEVQQAAASSDISFSTKTLKRMNATPEQDEGIKEINKENSNRVAPIYHYPFTIKANLGVLGASDFSLPPNATLKRINGSGANITIEGIIKYADQL